MRRSFFLRLVKGVLALAALLLIPPSCSIDPLVRELKNAREQAIFAIDDAIYQLNLDSESWRFTLDNLNSELSNEIQTTLSFNIPFIANVLSGEATSSLQCVTDAMAGKAVYLLQVLKSELISNEKVPLPAPLICNTSVGVIDLNAPRDIRRTVTYYGANFFSKDSLKMQLVSKTGEVQPVDLYKPTQYELVANLSNFSDTETSRWDYLALKYRNEEVSTMAIVRKEQRPPQIQTVNAAIPEAGILAHNAIQNGDPNFYNDTDVTVSAEVRHTRKEAYIQVRMWADEVPGYNNDKNATRAYGQTRKVFYTAPYGWHIKRIEGRVFYPSLFWFRDKDKEEDIEHTDLGQISLFARGSVAGSSTRCVINFNRNFAIVLEEDL